jgi:uncharacterized protein YqgC (DUF456 family)
MPSIAPFLFLLFAATIAVGDVGLVASALPGMTV